MTRLLIYFSIVFFSFSCNVSDPENRSKSGNAPATHNTASKKLADGDHCYSAEGLSDTLVLRLRVQNAAVSGSLDTKNREGVNTAILEGVLKSDTVFATQRTTGNEEEVFTSVIFLLADSLVKRAKGEMIQDEDAKWVFKNLSSINFRESRIFQKSDCGN